MAAPLFQKILVPVAYSPCSEEAFRVAISMARVFQSEVIVLHVVDTKHLEALNALGLALPSEEVQQKKRLRHYARLNARRLLSLDDAKGVSIQRLILEGSPFVEIARTVRAEKVALVVMGSYGGIGDVNRIFFGSTAEKVVRTAGCPVLTVPLAHTVPSRSVPRTRGMKIPEMWDAALEGRLKGLWIIGYDVAQTDPNLHKVREALGRLECLVVQDPFMSETAKLAHLVIPGASFLEKDGTFTNLERRIQRIRKAMEPPDGVLPDWQVVSRVSTPMGYPMHYGHPSEIMDEMSQLTPMFAGVSYARLEHCEGLQWPVPDAEHPGTFIMHRDVLPLRKGPRLGTAGVGGCNGKANFVPVDYLPPGESPDEAYPFVLITGRVLQHYNCGAQTRRTDIVQMVDTDVLEMHVDDAKRLQIEDGETVRLVSARSDATLPVVVSERVRPGELFTSFHFPSTNVNALLSSSADESSKCPEYKVSAVRVERYVGVTREQSHVSHSQWRLIN
ncbi:universal stress protein [Nitrospira sp. Nam74]